MTVVKKSDWNTEPLPARSVTIELDRTYSPAEFETIRRGLKPEVMEDKWFIYWRDGALHFHSSWTGFYIYRVRFMQTEGGWRMVSADVNREPEQYGEVDDSADAAMIPYLIDVLLLHRLEAYLEEHPDDDSISDVAVLDQWGLVGRAMLGQHPEANEDASGEPQEGADDEDE